jgi:hypothetical protein
MDEVVTGLIERLAPLIGGDRGAVVLERVARGGGETRWFYCRTVAEIEQILPRLRPGSRVGFFFDDRLRRAPFSDSVEEELWSMATEAGEVLLGTERQGDPELDMVLLDPSDFSEHLAEVRAGEVVFYGLFPAIEDDGVSAVSFIPPDQDGVVRPQPT